MKLKFLLLFFLLLFISPLTQADEFDDQNNFDSSYQNYDFSREFPPPNEARSNRAQQRVSRRVYNDDYAYQPDSQPSYQEENPRHYSYNLPSRIQTNEKVVLVDPNIHAWGAYNANGNLVRAGLATAGASWCPDIGRPCKTRAGVFRVYSLGSSDCISSKYPIEEGGGAPMPYCMYFNGSQGLHGSGQVVPGNLSHGCVRLRVSDAAWLRFNFVNQGTKVIVRPY